MIATHTWITRPVRLLAAAGLFMVALPGPPSMAQTQEMSDAGGYGSQLHMGQWDHTQIGFFVPLAEDQLVTKKYWGLRHTETWFDFFLRNPSGKYFLISNAVQNLSEGSELTARQWLPSMQSSPTGLVPDPHFQAWSGKAAQEITPDKMNHYTVQSKVSTEDVSFNEKTLEWNSKNGDIHLKGELVAPAMQLILPWREPSGATDLMYYTAQFYKLDGKYYDDSVNGYSLIEHMWGTKNYGDTWWVRNRVGHWIFWTTTYDDGTTDMGDLMCGRYGARGAVIANSKTGRVLDTTELNAKMTPEGRIIYTFVNGPKWEFVPDPMTTQMPKSPRMGDTSIGIGTVKRVDEKRKIVRSQALYLTRQKMCEPMPLGQIVQATH